MSLTKVSYSMISNAPANVIDFGAVGDGVTDDTVAIQATLDSGALCVVFPFGYTFLVNGGLTTTQNGQTIIATGATIKLKNSASINNILKAEADNVTVNGGIWDGNRQNGNTTGTFDAYGIFILGDNNTVENIISVNSLYIGVRGEGNYMTVKNSTVSETTGYGIFFGGSDVSQVFRGNAALHNNIDMSSGGTLGQGILFTTLSGLTTNQFDWQIIGNKVIGSQDPAIASRAINLAVRGNNGICSNNVTKYGAMGFSEGGDNSIISDNIFTDLVGSIRYGIEPLGTGMVVSNNVVQGARRGISISNGASYPSYDNYAITGNKIKCSGIGISMQMDSLSSANDCIISGNIIYACDGTVLTDTYAIALTREIRGLTISSNIIKGYNVAGTQGVFFDQPPTGDMNVNITGNTISDFSLPFSCAIASGATVNNMNASNNTLVNLASANIFSAKWFNSGSGAFGVNVINVDNINFNSGSGIAGAKFSLLDNTENLLVRYGTSTPEGVITANVGSLFLRTDGGATTTLYVKTSGTGNTGWTAK